MTAIHPGTTITPENREAWLAERRKSIGASEAAAALGLSPWKSPIELWQEKVNRVAPEPENEYMRLGTLMEPVVRELYETHAEGCPLAESQVFVQHPRLCFMTATLDGVISPRRLVEFKTAWRWSEEWGDEGSDAVPDAYFVQCQHQMACSGAEVVDLAALVLGKFRIYRIERNDGIVSTIEQRLKAFWGCVTSGVPPMWGKITAKELGIINPECEGTIEGSAEIALLAEEYERARAEVKVAEDVAEDFKLDILRAMGCHQYATLPDGRRLKRYLTSTPARTAEVQYKASTKHYVQIVKGSK